MTLSLETCLPLSPFHFSLSLSFSLSLALYVSLSLAYSLSLSLFFSLSLPLPLPRSLPRAWGFQWSCSVAADAQSSRPQIPLDSSRGQQHIGPAQGHDQEKLVAAR